jgi:hypothetical protein
MKPAHGTGISGIYIRSRAGGESGGRLGVLELHMPNLEALTLHFDIAFISFTAIVTIFRQPSHPDPSQV